MSILFIVFRLSLFVLYLSLTACATKKASKLRIDPHSIRKVTYTPSKCKEENDYYICDKVKLYPGTVQVNK